jgi:hypothetical protein
MYILKVFLNAITAGNEAFVSGNTFLYVCVKEVYRLGALSRFDTSQQLLITVEALWSQPILQVGKQVVVARSENRVVRRMVKQHPAEMLEQCASASSCMWTRDVMQEHYTVCQHSTPFVMNGSSSFFVWSMCVHPSL